MLIFFVKSEVFSFKKSGKSMLSFTELCVWISSKGKFQDGAGLAFLDTNFTDENKTFKDGFGH